MTYLAGNAKEQATHDTKIIKTFVVENKIGQYKN